MRQPGYTGPMRAHEIVLERIESDLAAGRLSVGNRLPGERALAEELGISRSSVREAIRVLEAMGMIRTAVGSGPRAGAIIAADPAASMTTALRLHVAAQTFPVQDVVRTRILLETWAVDAAARQEAVDLSDVEALLDEMDEPGVEPDRFHRLDAEMHAKLAAHAGNAVVREMMASLRGSIHGYVMAAVPLLDDWKAVADNLRAEHRGIVAAVQAGHPSKASRLVREHIEGFHGLTAETDSVTRRR